MRSEDIPNGGFMVHHNSKKSLVVEVKSKQHVDQTLIEFEESVLCKINEVLNLAGIVSSGIKEDVCSRGRWVEDPDPL